MPTEPTYHNNLGLTYFERGMYSEAILSYEKAIQLENTKLQNQRDPCQDNMSFYHKNLGLALYHIPDMDRALEEYEKAIECNRDNADNFFNRGNVWLNQERFDLAHEDFDAAIQREDRNAKFYHAKGLAFQSEAEKITKDRGDRDVLRERIESAIDCFRQAVEFSNTFIAAMFHLGLMYRRIENFHDALIQFTNVESLL